MPFITRLPPLTGADPYPDALLALDFVGARRGPQYYKSGGVTVSDITQIPGWTYTGGASGGSYAPKADGSLQLFANNVPRITDAGYLAEEARTNLLLRSQEFDNADWTKVDATVTTNQSTAPDGASTADLITTTVAGNPRVYQQLGVSGNGSAYTGSVYIKAGTTTDANALLYVNSGSPASVTMTASILSGPGSITSAGVISGLSTTQWTRIALTGTPSSATGNLAFYVRPRVSGSTIGDTIYVWGAQLELGSFALSPIPTTSVAVTRDFDQGYINGIAVPTSATAFGEFTKQVTANVSRIVGVGTGAVTPIYIDSTGIGNFNGSVGLINTATLTNGVTYRAASSWTPSGRSVTVNGQSPTSDGNAMPAITRVNVGFEVAQSIHTANAPIRRIVIYPRAMSNAELQAITTAGAY
jgi:hypothetical protein